MATRSRTSFQKRQREVLRMEKRQEKAARRLERKLSRESGAAPTEPDAESAEVRDDAEPE